MKAHEIAARTRKRVLASTQYGLGFIITEDNEIVFRDDSMTHQEREALASEVNALNAEAERL